MANPTIFWGVIRNEDQFGPRNDAPRHIAIRVTRDSGRQISGVRDGEINSITTMAHKLIGRFSTEEAARGAISYAEKERKPLDAHIEDHYKKARDLERQREAYMKKIFETYPGALTNA